MTTTHPDDAWQLIRWVGTPATSIAPTGNRITVALLLNREPDRDWLTAFAEYYQQVPVSLAQRASPPVINATSDQIRFTIDHLESMEQWLEYIDQKIAYANDFYQDHVLPARDAEQRRQTSADNRLDALEQAAEDQASRFIRPGTVGETPAEQRGAPTRDSGPIHRGSTAPIRPQAGGSPHRTDSEEAWR